MSDVSSQKSGGEDSAQMYPGNDMGEERKGEDSWTDVSLNDDSDAKVRHGKFFKAFLLELE